MAKNVVVLLSWGLFAALGASCAAPVHGPVALGPDHRSFVDGEGHPSFWMGDTQWELFTAYRLEEAEELLEDRREKGFSAVQVMLLGVAGGRKPNVHGDKPFQGDSLRTPNEAFFSRVDAILEIAARKDLVLVIGIYHKSADYGKMITRENARAWGQWVGRRYRGAPNLIWSMYPEAKDSYLPLVRELAAGLAEGDGGRHLITVHPDPAPASSSFIHAESWLSFNTLQSWASTRLNFTMVSADYARSPVKPVVNGEARYEAEDGTTPLQVRNGAWWSLLAGGFYSYGHGGNWMSPARWRDWVDAPASRQMKILADFARGLDWWTLVPDPSVVSGDVGDRASARSSNRDWAVVYLPRGGTATVDLGSIRTPGPVVASWLNPESGHCEPAGSFPASGARPFSAPPGWKDAVLFLRSESRAGR